MYPKTIISTACPDKITLQRKATAISREKIQKYGPKYLTENQPFSFSDDGYDHHDEDLNCNLAKILIGNTINKAKKIQEERRGRKGIMD